MKKSSRQKNNNQNSLEKDETCFSEKSNSSKNKSMTKDQIIDELKNELESLNQEKSQFHQIAQRSQADLINYRNRTEQDKKEIREKSKHNIILKLIEAVDDVERAISSLPKNSNTDEWQAGIDLIQKSLIQTLESEGVLKTNPLHQPFDPFNCEAVLYQETKNAIEGQVIEVMRTGYMINEKILRPAQVVVAQNENNKTQEENNNA